MISQHLIDDALATVRAAWPDKSVCITTDHWHHNHIDEPHNYSARCHISLLPGLRGMKCTQFWDDTLLGAVRKCLAALPNDLDDTAELPCLPIVAPAEAVDVLAEPVNVLIAN